MSILTKNSKIPLIALLSGSLILGAGGAANAANPSEVERGGSSGHYATADILTSESQTEEFLNIAAKIPDEVLERGDVATSA